MAKTPTWQRKAGQNPNGGLNEAGRRSLKAAGHDIKRPQPEGGSRRDSFCARMKGMKAKLTSAETANDPDSRINKSLRAWNCHADGGPVWEKDRPKGLGKPQKLTPSEKRSAKASAKAAGRPYPNLVDNMRAARADGGALKAALELAAKAGRNLMSHEDILKRVPELQDLAKRGDFSNWQRAVDKYKPVAPWTTVPEPASYEQMLDALHASKKAHLGLGSDIPEGRRVGLRLDIPSYVEKGVWVPTIHESGTSGKKLAHEAVARVKNATFDFPQANALKVAQGSGKSPFAKIEGDWTPSSTQEALDIANRYLNHPDWAQIGMDPERHAYFYDRVTQEPIKSAEDVVQVGPFVLGKNPTYGKRSDYKYADGGDVRPEMGAGGDAVKAALKAAEDIIRAYHGSPYKFNKFDISKIGTGEGAQAYGHGLYFAGNENVAKSYRDALGRDAILLDGNKVVPKSGTPEDIALAHLSNAQYNRYSNPWAIADKGIRSNILEFEGKPDVQARYENARNVLANWQEMGAQPTTSGHMYEVAIHANPKSMLDWDKSIANQRNILDTIIHKYGGQQSLLDKAREFEDLSARLVDAKKAPVTPSNFVDVNNKYLDLQNAWENMHKDPTQRLGSLLEEINKGPNSFGYNPAEKIKGSDFYRAVSPSKVEATKTLLDSGIPGIKYLDQGSRGAGEGSSNYVVFDPKIIDIMRRYARGGMTRHGYATDGSVEGDVSFLDTPYFEDSGSLMARVAPGKPQKDASEFIKQELAYGDKQLPQYDPEAGKETGLRALEIAKAAGYLTPASPYIAVGDFAKQMLTGEPIGAAMASAFLPGGKYAKMAGAALASQAGPEEAEAGPYTKFLMELAEKYRPHYDPSAMIKGQPKDKWISDVGLSRPIQDMKVRTTEQRNMIPEARIEPVEMANKAMISGFGDRTPAGYVVTHLNDKELTRPVNVLGGPAFSRDLAAQIDKAYWGSNRSRAAALANKGKEAVANKYEDPVFAYIAQGPQSQDFSHQMTDMILGQLRPSKMDKGMVENFDRLMREAEIKKGMPGIPTWPGLKSKELRDWLLTSKEGGAGRAKMAKLMDKSMYLKAPGFADVGVARYATTHPELLNTPIFSSGHMFSRMDPLGELITKPKVPHPSYDTLLAAPKGKQGYIGGFEYTLPPELHYYDYLSGQKSGYQTGIRPDLVEKPFSQKTMSLMRETPTVIGTPRWVDMASEYQKIMRGLYGRRP